MNGAEIEERSFRNLVEHYREELLLLSEGGNATTIFTSHRHTHLKRHGVIHRVPHRRYTRPTQRAMAILTEKVAP